MLKVILRHARTLMRNRAARSFLFLFALFPSADALTQPAYPDQIRQLLERDSTTIVITDSGLGGLSVCADLEALFRNSQAIRRVRLVFVNALPDLAYTYNSMASIEEQARVFDGVLTSISTTVHPDAILIACNTLSALYPKTAFARNPAIPVISIIDVGSKMIAERARASKSTQVVIFGTPSTIASGIYQEKLSAFGIDHDRIVAQPCKLLESEIQADPNSDLVNSLVETYVDETMEKISTKASGRLSVGLCCSHYGYSTEAFRQSLRQKVGKRFELLNPNKAMVALFNVPKRKSAKTTRISVEVLSRVPLTDQEVQSIASALAGTSRRTAEALRHYQLRTDLFPLKR
jgi:glutamate racemase